MEPKAGVTRRRNGVAIQWIAQIMEVTTPILSVFRSQEFLVILGKAFVWLIPTGFIFEGQTLI